MEIKSRESEHIAIIYLYCDYCGHNIDIIICEYSLHAHAFWCKMFALSVRN